MDEAAEVRRMLAAQSALSLGAADANKTWDALIVPFTGDFQAYVIGLIGKLACLYAAEASKEKALTMLHAVTQSVESLNIKPKG